MRAHNFGAGPCTLPAKALQEAQEEMLDFRGSGMSVVELSHRSAEYQQLHDEVNALARSVSGAPDDFDVLTIQGGATLQFAMAPMNLLAGGKTAGFVNTGAWAKKAYSNAKTIADTYVAWDGGENGYTTMPGKGEVEVKPGTRYIHVCTNETIGGIRMVDFPDTDVPLVADMSSEFLTRPIDWGRYDLVYGGVQKNLGPAGMALVFIRKSVAAASPKELPDYLKYSFHAENDSLGNTPAMFPMWIMGKVLKDIADTGGIAGLEKRSAAKSSQVYKVIDSSDGFYRNPVDPRVRSYMNVVFRLPTEDLEKQFVSESKAARLIGLKGHRSVGGIRASLYAALPQESVDALCSFMETFAKTNR